MPDICDYEGSDYKDRFWTADRHYEDLVERQALRRLLPPHGNAIADLGAGFGRIADLYAGYDRVILLDYSRTMLKQAHERHGRDPRFLFVASDIRRLPLATSSLDTVVTVRVLHHLRDITPAIQEAARVLAPAGTYVLEFASKRHLKAILRYLLRRQTWSPFALEPVEFAPLNLDFHPSHVATELALAGFRIRQRRALSLFRWQPLKARVAPTRLAALDAALEPLASVYPLTPSVLLRATADKPAAPRPPHILACPHCHGPLDLTDTDAACTTCRLSWSCADGIYDFKAAPAPI